MQFESCWFAGHAMAVSASFGLPLCCTRHLKCIWLRPTGKLLCWERASHLALKGGQSPGLIPEIRRKIRRKKKKQKTTEHSQTPLLNRKAPFMEAIMVSKELFKGLNPAKALGPDELHLRVLKELAPVLVPVSTINRLE